MTDMRDNEIREMEAWDAEELLPSADPAEVEVDFDEVLIQTAKRRFGDQIAVHIEYWFPDRQWKMVVWTLDNTKGLLHQPHYVFEAGRLSMLQKKVEEADVRNGTEMHL